MSLDQVRLSQQTRARHRDICRGAHHTSQTGTPIWAEARLGELSFGFPRSEDWIKPVIVETAESSKGGLSSSIALHWYKSMCGISQISRAEIQVPLSSRTTSSQRNGGAASGLRSIRGPGRTITDSSNPTTIGATTVRPLIRRLTNVAARALLSRRPKSVGLDWRWSPLTTSPYEWIDRDGNGVGQREREC